MGGTRQKPSEIQDRVRKNYIDRMGARARTMRKLLANRSWAEIKRECEHLHKTAPGFDFQAISGLAKDAINTIPTGKVPKAKSLPEAKKKVEQLIAEIDREVFKASRLKN